MAEESTSSVIRMASMTAASDGDNAVAAVAPAANKRRKPFDRYWLHKLVFPDHHPLQVDDDAVENDSNDDTASSIYPPILALAPMVDASDLPFRLLCRQYCNANADGRRHLLLCFTPMIHSKLYCTSAHYRDKFHIPDHHAFDRPLIAQLCGFDTQYLIPTAQALAPYVDGIDLNCGCPQGIAKRGNYGAFLLEKQDALVQVVKHLVQALPSTPVSVKVRLLPGKTQQERIDASLALYERLVFDSGIQLLTIHGRTRFEKGRLTGAADWQAIQTICQRLASHIPILANGGIDSYDTAMDCWKETGADGIMSSEALLEFPPLFRSDRSALPVPSTQLALEYLDLAERHPPQIGGQGSGIKCIRIHLHRFLHADLQVHARIRQAVIDAETIDEMREAVHALQEIHKQQRQRDGQEQHDVDDKKALQLSWYMRYRQHDATGGEDAEPAVVPQFERESTIQSVDLVDDAGLCMDNLFG